MKACKRFVAASVGAALSAITGTAFASGFQLLEQNASGLGNAYAGQAAAAENASTIFFNPAGMTRLPGRQVTGAINFIKPSAEFTNTGGSAAAGGFASPAANGGDAGHLTLLPNTYASWQITPQIWIGLGVSVPFGLATEYDEGWVGRFQSRKSEVKTIDINPSIALKVSDAISIGAGVSYQRATVKVDRSVLLVPGAESRANINLDDHAFGFNAGAMFQVAPQTRVGVTYRSAIKYDLEGDVFFRNIPGLGTATNNLSAQVKLPETISVALSHAISRELELLSDVTFTRWSRLKRLPLTTTSTSAVAATGTTLDTFAFEFRDTWRVGLGANYKLDDDFMIKVGAAYDRSPVTDFYRTVTLPDNNRIWLAIGAKHRLNRQATLDWGYAHVFIKEGPIDQRRGVATPPFQGNVIGNYDSDVNILSVQLTYGF
jgi:long-chain fatty acid transport protein